MRVVVVDDDPGFLDLVSVELRATGIEVTVCDPASHDCFALITGSRPDAVVLDWRIPGEPGPQLCRRLRASEQGESLAIIFLTGLSDPRDQSLARHAGADAYLEKGLVRPQALAAKIRASVAERATQRAHTR